MKKLLALIISGVVLVGCNNSGSQFVGTWSGVDSCKTQTIVITQNDGGTGYSVKDIKDGNELDNFVATLDGNTLVVDAGMVGKIPLRVENNQIEWKNINRAFSSKCALSKQQG